MTKPVSEILAICFSDQSAPDRQLFLKDVSFLAGTQKADVHILSPTQDTALLKNEVSELGLAKEIHGAVVVHSGREELARRALALIDKYSIDLVAFTDGSSYEVGEWTGVQRELLEKVSVPIMILPVHLDWHQHRVSSFVVPVSSEKRPSEALEFSLALAEPTKIPVDLFHVTSPGRPGEDLQGLESVGDQFHHEYDEFLDRVISTASPFSGMKQKKLVRTIHHGTGSTVAEITHLMKKFSQSILVLEWKGSLEAGRAATLKKILTDVRAPILLVKTKVVGHSRLKIGKEVMKSERLE